VTFGLSKIEFDFLNDNLIQPLKEKHAIVYIFGSRATQKNHKFSDIDILYTEDSANPIESSFTAKILTFFEESKFPYKIDLVNEKNLASSYRDSVIENRVLV